MIVLEQVDCDFYCDCRIILGSKLFSSDKSILKVIKRVFGSCSNVILGFNQIIRSFDYVLVFDVIIVV